MNIYHPKEEDIQRYAMAKAESAIEVIQHIESCYHCMEEVENYNILFSGIRQQQAPGFDFDVSALVLSQIPETKSRLSTDNVIAGFLVIFIVSCIAIPLYLFRKSLSGLFTDIPPFFVYAIVASTGIFLLYKILSMYKKYQGQMRLINFSSSFGN
jgi:hypothetical protein